MILRIYESEQGPKAAQYGGSYDDILATWHPASATLTIVERFNINTKQWVNADDAFDSWLIFQGNLIWSISPMMKTLWCEAIHVVHPNITALLWKLYLDPRTPDEAIITWNAV